jgi:hypothetical protein
MKNYRVSFNHFPTWNCKIDLFLDRIASLWKKYEDESSQPSTFLLVPFTFVEASVCLLFI